MASNNDINENEKYRQDIDTIKNILIKVDEKSIYESWVFTAAGILFILASVIHYVLYRLQIETLYDSFLRIWLPVTLIMLFLEPIALISKMSKESLPVLSRTIIKLYLGIIGLSTASVFICYLIAKSGIISILPVYILAVWAIFYFYLSQLTYTHLSLHGYIMVFLGIIIYNTDIPTELQFITAGAIIGISMLTAGITEMRKEKRKNEE